MDKNDVQILKRFAEVMGSKQQVMRKLGHMI